MAYPWRWSIGNVLDLLCVLDYVSLRVVACTQRLEMYTASSEQGDAVCLCRLETVMIQTSTSA